MTRDELEAISAELLAADEESNAAVLAGLAWRLYAEAGLAQAEIERLQGMLRSLRATVPLVPMVRQPAARR